MHKVGEGYYYTVWDTGNGKVVKKQKTKTRTFLYIFFSRLLNPIFSYKEFKKVLKNILSLRNRYEQVLLAVRDRSLLAYPELLQGINYTQDKVTLIKGMMSSMADEDFSKMVFEYTELIKKLWCVGIHDSVFNFTLNNGYTNDGKMALIDFNEVTFQKSDALKDIHLQRWLEKFSYKSLNKSQKAIFQDIMNRELTEKTLNDYWLSSR